MNRRIRRDILSLCLAAGLLSAWSYAHAEGGVSNKSRGHHGHKHHGQTAAQEHGNNAAHAAPSPTQTSGGTPATSAEKAAPNP
jgi:hypothetical protein